jgi:hypothetical protein
MLGNFWVKAFTEVCSDATDSETLEWPFKVC